MVQILPPKTNLGTQLGQAIGQGLQGGLEKGFNRAYERSMTEQGLNEALKAAEGAQGDPIKLAFAFAKAGSYSPYLERAIGPLYAEAVKRTGASEVPSGLKDAGTGTAKTVPNQSAEGPQSTSGQAPFSIPKGKPISPEIEAEAQNYLLQVRPDLVDQVGAFGQNVPTFDFDQKSDLRPEEEANLREKLLAKKMRPENIDTVVNRVREDIKTKWNEAKQRYAISGEQIQQIQNKWKDVQKIADERLPILTERYEKGSGTQQNLVNKYNQYAQQQPINLTPEAIHTNAMVLLQRDMNKLDALHALPSAPPFRNPREWREWMKPIQQDYKDLVDLGYLDAVREDAIKNKDLGIEDMHAAIWGDQTSKELMEKLYSRKLPVSMKLINEKTAKMMPGNKDREKQHQKYIDDLSQDLKKLGPKDDLVLLRGTVLDNGGTEQDFIDALNKSGVELSPFQKSQIQELNNPRIPPLWKFFTKEGFPLINLLRGKR